MATVINTNSRSEPTCCCNSARRSHIFHERGDDLLWLVQANSAARLAPFISTRAAAAPLWLHAAADGVTRCMTAPPSVGTSPPVATASFPSSVAREGSWATTRRAPIARRSERDEQRIVQRICLQPTVGSQVLLGTQVIEFDRNCTLPARWRTHDHAYE